MGDAYTVEDAAYDIRGLAEGVHGLEHRLDQYEAAQNSDEPLPPGITDMDEMRDEITAYFRDTLPHLQETASWGCAHLRTVTRAFRDEIREERGASPERGPHRYHKTNQRYLDAYKALNRHAHLTGQLTQLEQRAAELICPAAVAQAREDADLLEAPEEPVTLYINPDPPEDTSTQDNRF